MNTCAVNIQRLLKTYELNSLINNKNGRTDGRTVDVRTDSPVFFRSFCWISALFRFEICCLDLSYLPKFGPE